MGTRTNRPANADFSTTKVERLFGYDGKRCVLSDNASLATLLGYALPKNTGKVWIQPAGNIEIDWDAPASANSFLLLANTKYEIEGYKDQLDRIYLHKADGPVYVYIALFTDDTIAAEYETSGSSASTNSSSSSSKSSASNSSASSFSSSSQSSASRSSKSESSFSSASSEDTSQSSASSASVSSKSSSSHSSASTASTDSSSTQQDSSESSSSDSSASNSSASSNSSSSSSEST